MSTDLQNDKCSIGLASAMLDMSDEQFATRYIRAGLIRIDRLHQVSWRRVLWLYEQTRDRQRKRAIDEWRMSKSE